MLYFKYILVYSIFGFLFESEVYKINNSNTHSGILYGPYTFVYGFGVLLSILVHELLLKKIKTNKYLKILIYYIIFTILLSLIEYIGGNILNLVFNIDMWDYSNHQIHFGKYVCLTNSLIWGLLGTFNIYFLYPKIKEFLKRIPNIYAYISLIIIIIDLLITLITKI